MLSGIIAVLYCGLPYFIMRLVLSLNQLYSDTAYCPRRILDTDRAYARLVSVTLCVCRNSLAGTGPVMSNDILLRKYYWYECGQLRCLSLSTYVSQ